MHDTDQADVDERLTESVRVRLPKTLKARLEKVAGRERRPPAYVARRAVEREVERLEATSSGTA